MAKNGAESRFQFGPYSLDLEQVVLLRKGEIVRLPPKVVETLAALVEARGQLASKDELMSRLWPNTFVEEANLTRNVYLLRKTLGKRPDGSEYIETIPRRGYRFTAGDPSPDLPEPEWGPETGEPYPHRKATVSDKPPERLRRWAVVSGLAVSLVVATVVLIRMRPRPVVPLKQFPLTFNSSLLPVLSAALSPNGLYLAYADADGAHIRNVNTGNITNLALPQAVTRVAIDGWWPDGSAVLATAPDASPGRSTLWKLPVVGEGNAALLGSDASVAAIAADGAITAVVSGDHTRLSVVRDGKEVLTIRPPAANATFTAIAWLPNSNALEAIVQPGNVYASELETIHVHSNRTLLTWLPGRASSIVALRGGRSVFSIVGLGRFSYTNLWQGRIDARTGRFSTRPSQITDWDATDIYTLTANSTGSKVAFVRARSNIFVATGILGSGGALEDVRRMTLDDRDDYPHGWADGGTAILFESDRTGPWQIYEQTAAHSTARRLAPSAADENYPRLSPDGRWILYVRSSSVSLISKSATIMRMPVAGGPPQPVAQVKNFSNYFCASDAGGGCVLGEREGGRLALYALDPIKGLGKMISDLKLPARLAYDWALSPDGDRVAMVNGDPDRGVIRLFSLRSGTDRAVTVAGWRRLRSIAWRPDGRGWFAGLSVNGRGEMLGVQPSGKAAVIWQSQGSLIPYAVPSPDGQRIAFPGRFASDQAWMLEGF